MFQTTHRYTHRLHDSSHTQDRRFENKMTELANEFSGASILSASSFDIKHPPSSVIDGEYNSFWLTTGSFPQEIVVQLGEVSQIKGIEIISSGIRKVEISKCESAQANMWESILENEVSDSENDVQKIMLQVPPRITTQYLRIKVFIPLITS